MSNEYAYVNHYVIALMINKLSEYGSTLYLGVARKTNGRR